MIMALIITFYVDGKYEAVRDEEIVTYSKCYKEHGQNVCEGAFNSKVIVEDYWKK